MATNDFSRLADNLKNKGYRVSVFAAAADAVAYLAREIDGATVGFGGSMTLHQLNLFPALQRHNTVYWHDEKPEGMSVMETRRAASRAAVYVSSVNGIAETGEIVNIDGTGNRVAAISFGPEKVYLIVGRNKLAPTLSDAVARARNVASPRNCQRLARRTPCAVKGDRCFDCQSPDRICRVMTLLLEKPSGADYEVLLIDEELGY